MWFDQVDSWSNERFKNGCFGYFLGGEFVFSMKSTLGVDFYRLKSMYSMGNSVEDEELFKLPDQVAYKNLCSRSFPPLDSDAENSDFRYLVSAESLSDDGWYVFLVEFGTQAKLIFGFENDPNSVGQVVLERGEFQRVVAESIEKSGCLISHPSTDLG
ncbi:Imm42 family immunity protein [Pandoraea sp. SD6-2]|uniref:Imm42 family immunity protein n=1 Tax=Pandoraea sp. SD6-2 TaxID=1286093 RepID=UPI001FEEF3E4|nr:Imm42 family immunity protein [Pandoraea sp. SD6-2]